MREKRHFIRKKILFDIIKCLEPHLIFSMVAPLIMVLKSLNIINLVFILFLFIYLFIYYLFIILFLFIYYLFIYYFIFIYVFYFILFYFVFFCICFDFDKITTHVLSNSFTSRKSTYIILTPLNPTII